MIKIKNQNEIEIMRQGGKILASVLSEVSQAAKPGVTTAALDELAEKLIYQNGALPGFKGFDGYPATLCTSVNEEIVHALPSERQLKEGDIIGLDLGVLWPSEKCATCAFGASCVSQRGMFTDAAITVPVGQVSEAAQEIIEAAKGALDAALALVKPDRKLSEVSSAIEQYAKQRGFAVIRDLFGHGVGYELHEAPSIPNFGGAPLGEVILQAGMTLAIEPMLSAGSYQIKKAKDQYGLITADKSLSAHFEHTIAVTEDGCEILTKR
jgi:methionyl aminopeptidase